MTLLNKNISTSSVMMIKEASQERAVVSAILDAYRSDKFPHSWIISGPKGIGKSELAIRIAHFILSHPETKTAPDTLDEISHTDAVYSKIDAGSHPDFLLLQRSLNAKTGKLKQDISVDEARHVTKFFSRRAAGEGWRVCIIDTADDLNRSAGNALLKIVEEPPEKSVIIFISNTAGRLLPTLRSRCRTIKCAPLHDNDIINSLGDADLPHPDIELIAALSEGSLSKARLLSEGGLEIYREMLACLETLPNPEWSALNKFNASLTGANNKDKFKLFADLLINLIRRITVNTAKTNWQSALKREEELATKWQMPHKIQQFSALSSELEAILQDKDTYNLDTSLTLNTLFQHLAKAAK